MSVVLNSAEYIPTQREDIRKETDKILDDFMEALVNMTIITEIKSIAMGLFTPSKYRYPKTPGLRNRKRCIARFGEP